MNRLFKLIIILTITFSSFSIADAQKHNSFAGFRYGWALPMGEMASHEFGSGGYALLGKSIEAEAAWFITPKIGFGIDVSSNTFGFATGFYAEDYLETKPEYSNVEMLSGPYKLTTLMGGLYYKVSLTEKLSTRLKLMGGLFTARTPDQFYGVEAFMVGKLYFWKTSSLDRKFTFLTGAAFEYKLYDHVYILLQADYTYAKAAFKYNAGRESEYTDYMNMPVFRLQPGINISF